MMYEETAAGFSAGSEPLLSENCLPQIAYSCSSVASRTHDPSLPENVGLSMETLAFASQDAMIFNNIDTSSLIDLNPHDNYSNNTVDSILGEEVNFHDSNQLVISRDQSKLDTIAMNFHHQNHHHQLQDQPPPYPMTADVPPHHCNLLYGLPSRSSTSSFVNSTSSISFRNPAAHQKNFELQMNITSGHPRLGLMESTNVSSVLLQDPFLQMNLPAGSPANTEWFQSLPARRNDLLMLGVDDDKEGSGVVSYLNVGRGREFGDSNIDFLKFPHDLTPNGRSKGGRGCKRGRQVTIEKKRRVDFTSKFDALKELIPNPTKNDRASLLCGAIEYIQELRKSVHNLTLLVNKKRSCGKERIIKRHKVEEGGGGEALGGLESCNLKPLMSEPDHHEQLLVPINRCINSGTNWVQKKSEGTEVDVRIVEDDVTIKLVQRKNSNCLLHASNALDELELDLQHVAGGHIGDFCSFLFNCKIYEGSSVCASSIANKLIEVMHGSCSLKELVPF